MKIKAAPLDLAKKSKTIAEREGRREFTLSIMWRPTAENLSNDEFKTKGPTPEGSLLRLRLPVLLSLLAK
jgi:hypothetical protein